MKIGEQYVPYKLFKFSPIPDWIIVREELSMGAKIVFARLIKHFGKNGRCFPKQETLAKEVGIKLRQLKSYVRELKDNNLIAVKQVRRTSSEYFLLGHEWMPKELINSQKDVELKECSIRSLAVHNDAPFNKDNIEQKNNTLSLKFNSGKETVKETDKNRLEPLNVYRKEALNEKKALNDFSFLLCKRLKKSKDKVGECLRLSEEKKHGEKNCANALRLYDDLSYIRAAIGENEVNRSFSFHWIVVQQLSAEHVEYARSNLREAILAGGIINTASLYTDHLKKIAEINGISLDLRRKPKRGMAKAEPTKQQIRKVA